MDGYQITSDWLRARAADTPDAEALRIGGRVWTFGRLDELADHLCDALMAARMGRGDHIGLLMPNSLTMVCCIFAIARLGAVLVPLNTRLTVTELAWQIDHADCVSLLCSPSTETTVRRAAEGHIPVQVLPDDPPTIEQWLDSQPLAPPKIRDSRAVGLDSIQAIVYTSGTTGHPKGAMITFGNHLWSAIGSAFRLGISQDDRWLACLPLYHVGGLAILFRSCLYGTLVILHDGYDTQAVLTALAEDGVSIVSLIPTMLGWLLDSGLRKETAPHLRLVLLGGAATPPELAAKAQTAGIPLAVSYGLTEAASQVATLPPEAVNDKPGSVGRPLLFSTIAILNEKGREVPQGVTGEIAVSGPTVMAGYYADPEATRTTVGDGRLRTGDLGYVDRDGDLWVIERRSDLIVSGGENVYPAEVEGVLREHPAVASVCVVGLPNAVWGQQVAALVVMKSDHAATRDELIAHCRTRLAGYKQPRVVAFAANLPRTGSGKVHRHKVIERLISEAELS